MVDITSVHCQMTRMLKFCLTVVLSSVITRSFNQTPSPPRLHPTMYVCECVCGGGGAGGRRVCVCVCVCVFWKFHIIIACIDVVCRSTIV